MESCDDCKSNKILKDSYEKQEYEFKHNFLTVPWDDRTGKSKIGVIALLVVISLAIIVCIIQNFITHYKGFNYDQIFRSNNYFECPVVAMKKNRYAAKINSLLSERLLCVGAVLAKNLILTNEMCTTVGPVRVQVGSYADPRCKRGFSVEFVQEIEIKGFVSNKLALLLTHKDMTGCADPIDIHRRFIWRRHAHIIGRPNGQNIKFLSKQPVRFAGKGNCTFSGRIVNSTICVGEADRCPVRIGDLLVQNGFLYGIAVVQNKHKYNEMAYFADLELVYRDILRYALMLNNQI